MELQIRLAGPEVSREQWLGEIALGHPERSVSAQDRDPYLPSTSLQERD